MITYFGHLQAKLSSSTELLECCDWDENEFQSLLGDVKVILDKMTSENISHRNFIKFFQRELRNTKVSDEKIVILVKLISHSIGIEASEINEE